MTRTARLAKVHRSSEWDHQNLLSEFGSASGIRVGETDGMLVFNPSAFPKQGTESVGAQRQRAVDSAKSRTARSVSTWIYGRVRTRVGRFSALSAEGVGQPQAAEEGWCADG